MGRSLVAVVVMIAGVVGAAQLAGASPLRDGGFSDCTITQPKSLEGKVRTTIRFYNDTSGIVSVQWLDYDGKRVPYRALDAGTWYDQPTWNTHPWVALDANGVCIGYVIAPAAEYHITGDTKASPIGTPFRITKLTVPATVSGGGLRRDVQIAWVGDPTFPVRATISKTGCTTRTTCTAISRTFAKRTNPLLLKHAWWCRAGHAFRVTTEVRLVDRIGVRTPTVRATLVCTR